MAVLPPSPEYVGPLPHTGGEGNKPIRRIVIHCTAGEEPNPGAAKRTASWTRSNPSVVSSYHYCADSRDSVQAVWDSVVAYHCGYNSNSIGYELCCSLKDSGEGHWRQPDHQAMLRIAAEDIARLCLANSVPIRKLTVAELRNGASGICGHVDIRDAFPGRTTHWDPGPFFPWRDFIEKVQAVADRLQKPPPTPKAPHDPFTIALMPGRWNAPHDAWARRHKEARDNGAHIVTMTEGTNNNLVSTLQRTLGYAGWSSYHDPTPGPENIIHSWNDDRFEMVGLPWKVQLTDIAYYTRTGYKQPLPYSVGIALHDKQADRVLLIVAAHLPLENTQRRRKAKEAAIATLKDKAFDAGRTQYPHAARVFSCDWNRPSGAKSTRDWFKNLWPRFQAAWATNSAARQGPDWVAAGGLLAPLGATVLPRKAADPLDHTTKVTRWAWR